MKSPIAKSDAPGAKTPQNCPWWVRFRPDQGQKPHKTAPGGQVSGLTEGKNPTKLPGRYKTSGFPLQYSKKCSKKLTDCEIIHYFCSDEKPYEQRPFY